MNWFFLFCATIVSGGLSEAKIPDSYKLLRNAPRKTLRIGQELVNSVPGAGSEPSVQQPPVWEALEILRGNKDKFDTYPTLITIPTGSNFTCSSTTQPGYYADLEFDCQIFHYCDMDGVATTFICPVQTIYNQITLNCDWYYNVQCNLSTQFYNYSNARLFHADWPLLSDSTGDSPTNSSTTVTPVSQPNTTANSSVSTTATQQSSTTASTTVGNTTNALPTVTSTATASSSSSTVSVENSTESPSNSTTESSTTSAASETTTATVALSNATSAFPASSTSSTVKSTTNSTEIPMIIVTDPTDNTTLPSSTTATVSNSTVTWTVSSVNTTIPQSTTIVVTSSAATSTPMPTTTTKDVTSAQKPIYVKLNPSEKIHFFTEK